MFLLPIKVAISHNRQQIFVYAFWNRLEKIWECNHGEEWHLSRHDIYNILISCDGWTAKQLMLINAPFQLDICALNQDLKKGKEPSVARSLQSLLLSCPSIFWALQEGLGGNSLHQSTKNEEFCCFQPIPRPARGFLPTFWYDTTSFCSSSQPHLLVATNPHRNKVLAVASWAQHCWVWRKEEGRRAD